ncbi:uncharacterized protein LOC132057862 [Lycium ferocissimum]|uniref:uncharacterized protein LOC132057862 n=1 Tax=Lycium ferocissimum TaxID=112874 RepID=UPI0028163C05|nr:uncharacterized protein LOC132057862 [Lycium ferocissimum]
MPQEKLNRLAILSIETELLEDIDNKKIITAPVYGTNKPQVGFIYDTLDQAKETIKKELKHKKSRYAIFWEAIDDIWDEYLYSHLHAAGCYLNPTLFYSSDFRTDEEVSCGLCFCVARMAEDRHIQDSITLQIDKYRMEEGTFHDGSFKDKLSNISPALWWSQ